LKGFSFKERLKIQHEFYSSNSVASGSALLTNIATAGLAQVGSKAALNFAFAFLRRAWRSGITYQIT